MLKQVRRLIFTLLPSVPLQTALHLAVITEQPHLADRLLKAGADPLLADNSGNTALHIACKRGSLACFGVITQSCQRHLAAMVSFPNYNGNLSHRRKKAKRGNPPMFTDPIAN